MENYTSYAEFSIDTPTAQIYPYTTDLPGNYVSSFSGGETAYFDADIRLTETVSDVWVNATIRDNTGAWIATLVNQPHNFTKDTWAYLNANIAVADIPWITLGYAPGQYYLDVVINKTGVVSYQDYADFAIVFYAPGMQDIIDLLVSRSPTAQPNGNYTVGEEIYCGGGVEFNYDLANCDVTLAVYSNTIPGIYLAWPDNDTYSFTSGTTTPIGTIHGATPHFDTTGWAAGEYSVVWNFTHADLVNIHIFADFTLSQPRGAHINASAYSNISTPALSITNRFDQHNVSYFNGTIGTAYDVNNAIINITINTPSAYIATLYNGTHSFTGGTNESLTTIAGSVLNYTCISTGEFMLRIEVSKEGDINRTIVTEGFTVIDLVRNDLLPGFGIKYIDPAFFEWDLQDSLFVQFYDKTKTDVANSIISYIWDFGDGQGGTGANPEHQYKMPGEYEVTVFVYFTGGEVETFTSTVRVVDNTFSWFMYLMIGVLVFIGILIVGVFAVRKKSKRLSTVMFIILGSFIMISVIAMQMFTT